MILDVLRILFLSLLINILLVGIHVIKDFTDRAVLCQANSVKNADEYEANYMKKQGLTPLESEISRNQWLNMNDNHRYDYYSTDDNYSDDDDDHFDGGPEEDDESLFSEW